VEAVETAKEVLSFTSSSDMLNEAADKLIAQLWPSMANPAHEASQFRRR
jgi:hypothetical protein